MQTTRSNQGAHRTSWFAQLFIRYPIVVGFILMFALTWRSTWGWRRSRVGC
jgi:hypothetical protein